MNDLRILLTVSDDDEDCRFCVGENTEISRVRIFRLYRVIALLDPIVSIISSRRDPSVAVSSAAGKVRSRFSLARQRVGVVLDLTEQCTESVNDPACPHLV